VHSARVNSFLYLLWHTWRVICLEGQTQNLTSVCTVVKLTSTWSTSLGLNFLYLLWHTWRVICLEGQTQNLTSVCTVVKLTSTWSTSLRLNFSTFMRHMVQCMAMAGKSRGFITSISRRQCVKIIVCLLLSTVA